MSSAERARALPAHPFERSTAVHPVGRGRWAGAVDPVWSIGTGPNGGLVAALLVRAMTAAVADPDREPRSLTVHFLSPPAPGPVEIACAVERTGGATTSVSARLVQDGETRALALGAWSRWRRDALTYLDAAPPAVPPPAALERIRSGSGVVPLVDAFYDLRWAIGAPPFSGADSARVGGWMALHPSAPVDHAALAAFSDAWLPAVFARLEQRAAAPTIDLTVHFRAPLPAKRRVLGVFASRAAGGGFWEEDGELWSEDGVLLVQSRQLAQVRRLPAAA